MEAWDAARSEALGITDESELPPTARASVMRLNSRGRPLTWRDWLDLATANSVTRQHRLTAQRVTPPTGGLNDARVRYAARRVAGHLRVDALTPDDYDTGRAKLIGSDRRRRRGEPGAVIELLPTSGQLQHGRTWLDVLRIAGLKRVQRRGRLAGGAHPGGLPHADAQVVFARANGRFASRRELQRFMRDCGAALADWPDGRPYDACLDEAERCLRDEGVECQLLRPSARGGRHAAQYKLPPGGRIEGAPPSAKALRGEVSEDERKHRLLARCIEALREFDAWLAAEHPGVRATQKRYLAWQKGSDWPAHRNFQQFGGFTALLTEARRQTPMSLASR